MADVRAWLGDKWARLKAYVKSIPPDVWIGLGIGALALLLAWLAFRNKGTSSTSSDGLSTSNPIIPATATDPLSNPATDNSNILNWIDPAGNLKPAKGVKPVASFVDTYLAAMHNRNVVQSYDIHNASLLQTQNILASQHAGAITHSADIHTTSLANSAKAAASAAKAKVLGAATTRDESVMNSIISHPLAVVKPPTGKRQDVLF